MIITRIIIAGSRTVDPSIDDIDRAIRAIDPGLLLWRPDDWTEVICGKAKGADLAGARWARAKGKTVHEEPITAADVKRWGKYLAPKARNHRMAVRADAALIFWDRKSGGSADMAARMLLLQKSVRVIDCGQRPTAREGT